MKNRHLKTINEASQDAILTGAQQGHKIIYQLLKIPHNYYLPVLASL